MSAIQNFKKRGKGMKNKKAEANPKSVKTANNKIKKVEDQTMKGKGKEKERGSIL